MAFNIAGMFVQRAQCQRHVLPRDLPDDLLQPRYGTMGDGVIERRLRIARGPGLQDHLFDPGDLVKVVMVAIYIHIRP